MLEPVALQWILIGAGTLTGIVFMLAFRFALREGRDRTDDGALPAARVIASAGIDRASLVRGRAKGRALRGFHLFQAGAVAFGITAVFFMFLCLAAMVAVALVA